MDPLFWILAGVVVGCVIGIVIIWRLEIQAERRAADTQRVEAEVSARLKVFDPRAKVEEVDTRPIPAAPQPEGQKPSRTRRPVVAVPPSLTEKIYSPAAPPGRPAAGPAGPATPPKEVDAQTLPSVQLRPLPPNGATQPGALANDKSEPAPAAEALPSTPEDARLRAAELGRERRYLEQAIEEQQARLEQLMHNRTPGNPQEIVAITQLQGELAEQRRHLEEITVLEERYRQAATPSLEQLAQDYKSTASPHTPRAFGVRRHSLAPLEPPGKNPPAPPAQAKTDSSF